MNPPVFQDPVVVAAAIGGAVAIIVAIATLVGVLSQSSGTRKTAMEARLDKRVDEALARQDTEIAGLRTEMGQVREQGRLHMRAVGGVFRSIHDQVQWPDGRGPILNPEHIAALEDTDVLPPTWVRRRHSV